MRLVMPCVHSPKRFVFKEYRETKRQYWTMVLPVDKIRFCFYLFHNENMILKKVSKTHSHCWLRIVTLTSKNLGIIVALEARLYVSDVYLTCLVISNRSKKTNLKHENMLRVGCETQHDASTTAFNCRNGISRRWAVAAVSQSVLESLSSCFQSLLNAVCQTPNRLWLLSSHSTIKVWLMSKCTYRKNRSK